MQTLASHVKVVASPPETCREKVPLSGARKEPCHTISHSSSLKGSMKP
jgi:hypothetical protein